MENHELLQAIEIMLDKKLDEKFDEKLKPIHADIKALQKDVKQVKKQVNVVYEWVDGIDVDVRNIKNVVYRKV